MKYFKYKLKIINDNEKIGPDRYLPDDTNTGMYLPSDPTTLYGNSEIESLDVISDFQPVEITQQEFQDVIDQLNNITL